MARTASVHQILNTVRSTTRTKVALPRSWRHLVTSPFAAAISFHTVRMVSLRGPEAARCNSWIPFFSLFSLLFSPPPPFLNPWLVWLAFLSSLSFLFPFSFFVSCSPPFLAFSSSLWLVFAPLPSDSSPWMYTHHYPLHSPRFDLVPANPGPA
ncbi:hypothetical protein P170DRAFT_93102 [Aspergillus steynii IBT 23096]|uniref:Uncharacterized protein n=1 Tax=Aspergillus steynii IBT 23096 TaxID=1392250 RepID=A0A2I2GGB4_9EURO|nr:uncharacterized protein P170DRAFT_93102 [Aspergillus steynii IBT 23096]PLB51900.1 hypothetical protein P170DRAFT_93102 [Aspergillus steynii IBT 23096]